MRKLFTILLLSSLYVLQNSFSQNVTPQKDANGDFYFEFANVYFKVDVSLGARISSLKIDNKEVLYSEGSTFWPSPQTWGWPPSKVVDSDPYTGGIFGDSISLISGIGNFGGNVKVRKTFFASSEDTTITVIYTLINMEASPKSYAPWEITRVPQGGLTFFPYGEGEFSGYGDDLPTKTERINNAAWYEQAGGEKPHQKLFSDGKSGWLAYLNDDNILFIKKFEDIPTDKQAPAEAEIEVYFGGTYFEIENQGIYGEIPAGDSVQYSVIWYVRNLPEGTDKQAGSTPLLNYVAKVTKTTPVASGLKDTYKDRAKVYFSQNNKQLVITNQVKNVPLNIYDLNGKKVFSKNITSSEERINLNFLTGGTYFYELVFSSQIQKGKFLKR